MLLHPDLEIVLSMIQLASTSNELNLGTATNSQPLIEDKWKMAGSLVYLFESAGESQSFINKIICHEIDQKKSSKTFQVVYIEFVFK